MATISLKCKCGQVRGSATGITPASGNRVVCCCDSCQAFAAHLGVEADTLDEFGGTELFQTSQSQVQIETGQDKLQGLRLSEKGLLRWYTTCCNTPVGNTINAKMPFVGLIHTFIDVEDKNATLGPVRAYVQTKHATKEPDYPHHSAKFPIGITLRIIRKMLVWKVTGKDKPSAFFSDDGRPAVKPIVLSD